ncbi:uncharacterized protein STEHIDRAFT_160882 [Stereum hirsutum FP-91666 SS1]|uniref:uncharacterized protein n=1 Tax=Stereum hirsutum (strain FP-91666) TaxID=721885 RepID=UPI0004449560|nr:uncharacterized protein STEHIDRAFT_160882 [Stereum hirsutum FP-91666 SS1]EIM82333.1 hypothetical protein STEHIDRAFT_160882 [Stereum hirsutum FP-91666 SS1]
MPVVVWSCEDEGENPFKAPDPSVSSGSRIGTNEDASGYPPTIIVQESSAGDTETISCRVVLSSDVDYVKELYAYLQDIGQLLFIFTGPVTYPKPMPPTMSRGVHKDRSRTLAKWTWHGTDCPIEEAKQFIAYKALVKLRQKDSRTGAWTDHIPEDTSSSPMDSGHGVKDYIADLKRRLLLPSDIDEEVLLWMYGQEPSAFAGPDYTMRPQVSHPLDEDTTAINSADHYSQRHYAHLYYNGVAFGLGASNNSKTARQLAAYSALKGIEVPEMTEFPMEEEYIYDDDVEEFSTPWKVTDDFWKKPSSPVMDNSGQASNLTDHQPLLPIAVTDSEPRQSLLDRMTYYGELKSAVSAKDFQKILDKVRGEWLTVLPLLLATVAIYGAMLAIPPDDSLFRIGIIAKTVVPAGLVVSTIGVCVDLWFTITFWHIDGAQFETRARDYHYDTFLFFAITSKLPIAMFAISAVAGATFALTVVWSVYPAVAIVFFSFGLACCHNVRRSGIT